MSKRWFEKRPRRVAKVTALLLFASLPGHAADGEEGRFELGLETGAVGFSRNDVRVPGDAGTEFDMTALTGSGATAFARLDGRWRIDDRHGLRLVIAPLEVSGGGRLSRDTTFSGETFAAGETAGTYRFNAYKLTYRYTLSERGPWRWGIGFTGVVRDARIALRQGVRRADKENVGFVPALHLSGDYRWNERWSIGVDFDGLAGGPGRLFDIALKLHRELGERWRLGFGYRTLEGGADTEEVYNFAWLHYAVLDLRYRL